MHYVIIFTTACRHHNAVTCETLKTAQDLFDAAMLCETVMTAKLALITEATAHIIAVWARD